MCLSGSTRTYSWTKKTGFRTVGASSCCTTISLEVNIPYRLLCWLLRTSVRKVHILCTMEQASMPKFVRGEYNKQCPFCLYSSSNAHIFMKERVNLCYVYSPPSNNVSVSAFMRFKNVFCIGLNHRRPPLCLANSSIFNHSRPPILPILGIFK